MERTNITLIHFYHIPYTTEPKKHEPVLLGKQHNVCQVSVSIPATTNLIHP